MLTRRLFGKIAVASVAFPRLASAAADATIAGVRVGVQTYSFRDLPRPANGDAIDGGKLCSSFELENGGAPVVTRFEPVQTQYAVHGVDEPDFADTSALVDGKFSDLVMPGGAL